MIDQSHVEKGARRTISLKIAFVGHSVSHQAGPANVTACLIERLCEGHDISVFSVSVKGIDLGRIKHHRVPAIAPPKFSKSISTITFLVYSTLILSVLSLLRQRDYDVIHSMGYDSPLSASVITSHFCEKECLCLEETNVIEIPHKGLSQKLKALDHRIYRRFAVFIEGLAFGRNSSKTRIVVSEREREQFIRHYGSVAESIIVIPNAVDCETFTPANRPLYREQIRQKHGISRSNPVLMFVGGDWERKGVRYLIESLSRLVTTDVRLLIIGSGDEKSYGQLAEQRQVRERIVFVKGINTREYYAASDVFVFPTIYEPFGLVIVEAMASGLPVITSRSAGAADLITDGVDGFLLNEPSNINDLTARIELLLSNAELRKTIGERARKTAEKLSWDWVAEKTLEVYDSVAKRKMGVVDLPLESVQVRERPV